MYEKFSEARPRNGARGNQQQQRWESVERGRVGISKLILKIVRVIESDSLVGPVFIIFLKKEVVSETKDNGSAVRRAYAKVQQMQKVVVGTMVKDLTLAKMSDHVKTLF